MTRAFLFSLPLLLACGTSPSDGTGGAPDGGDARPCDDPPQQLGACSTFGEPCDLGSVCPSGDACYQAFCYSVRDGRHCLERGFCQP